MASSEKNSHMLQRELFAALTINRPGPLQAEHLLDAFMIGYMYKSLAHTQPNLKKVMQEIVSVNLARTGNSLTDRHKHSVYDSVLNIENTKNEIEALKKAFESALRASNAPAQRAPRPAVRVRHADQQVIQEESKEDVQGPDSARTRVQHKGPSVRFQQSQHVAFQDAYACEICSTTIFDAKDYCVIDPCGHIFCSACVLEHVRAQVEQRRVPVTCLQDGCRTTMHDNLVRALLARDARLLQKYEDFTLQLAVDMCDDDMSWCPTPDCMYLFVVSQNLSDFQCPKCHARYCFRCRVEYHFGMSCAEHRVNSTTSEQDRQFDEFVRGAKFKQCPKCKYWVEKTTGCDHMSCRCGEQFCYKCGGKYGSCECVRRARETAPQNDHHNLARRDAQEQLNPPNPQPAADFDYGAALAEEFSDADLRAQAQELERIQRQHEQLRAQRNTQALAARQQQAQNRVVQQQAPQLKNANESLVRVSGVVPDVHARHAFTDAHSAVQGRQQISTNIQDQQSQQQQQVQMQIGEPQRAQPNQLHSQRNAHARNYGASVYASLRANANLLACQYLFQRFNITGSGKYT